VSVSHVQIIELQELIQSNNLANVDQMEAELSKLAVKNEDLMKKIAALEREIHEAQTKAEALMSSIAREESDSASETGTSLKDQLDAALNQGRLLVFNFNFIFFEVPMFFRPSECGPALCEVCFRDGNLPIG
jgi:seryl-tRNA synthetase